MLPPELDSMIIPCITMISTHPIFYKILVTLQLSQAVITAQYPNQTTIITKCVVALTTRRLSKDIEVLEFQKIALQNFVAFWDLAKECWSKYMVGLK